MTPDGLHVCVSLFRVKSARNCGVSTYLLGGRARRRSAILGGVTCDGAFCALYSGFEHILKQAFQANLTWTTMSHLLAWTGSGVLRKAMKGKLFGFSIAQGGPVPEDILAWYVFDMISTPNTQK